MTWNVVVFDRPEEGRKYQEWVSREDCKDGFVLNVDRPQSIEDYPKLHSAKCPFISNGEKNYVSKRYYKVCSLDRNELERWSLESVDGPRKAPTPCTCL